MSGLLDSSDGGEEWSLEQYIKNTERLEENEVGKSIRLWEWQDTDIIIIGVDINTNGAEIVNRAYSLGLEKLREDIGDDIQDVNEMLSEFLRATSEIHSEAQGTVEVRSDISNVEIDLDGDYGDLTEPKRFPLRDSELSEVKDRYIEKNFFGGWLHRVVIALGLKESENVGDESIKLISSIRASLNDSVEDSRKYVERRMRDFVGKNVGKWINEGVSDEAIGHLENAVENMETEYSSEIETMIDAVGGDNDAK